MLAERLSAAIIAIYCGVHIYMQRMLRILFIKRKRERDTLAKSTMRKAKHCFWECDLSKLFMFMNFTIVAFIAIIQMIQYSTFWYISHKFVDHTDSLNKTSFTLMGVLNIFCAHSLVYPLSSKHLRHNHLSIEAFKSKLNYCRQ